MIWPNFRWFSIKAWNDWTCFMWSIYIFARRCQIGPIILTIIRASKKGGKPQKTSNWISNLKTATGQKQQQLCIFLSMVQLWKKTRPILSHIKIHEIPNCTFHPFFPWFWLEDNGWLCWFLCDSRGPRGSGETTQPPNCPAQVSEASMSRDFWSYLHCMWGSLGLKKSSWKVI